MSYTPVIANSLPLGGNFLLMNLLESFGYQKYAQNQGTPQAFNYKEIKEALAKSDILENKNVDDLGDYPIAVSPFAPCYVNQNVFRHWLEVVPTGYYISSHIPWTSGLSPLLADLNYRHILILRDLHAILTELAYGKDIIPRFLRADLENLTASEKLDFFLTGGNAAHAGVTIKSFSEIYRSMQAWNNDSSCLVVNVEDLMNKNKQRAVLAQMADYLAIRLGDVDMHVEMINRFSATHIKPSASVIQQQGFGSIKVI